MTHQTQTVRGTQSFVNILGQCWRRPKLLALELLWRWLIAIPLLIIAAQQLWHIYTNNAAQIATTGIDSASLTDPMGAAATVAGVYAILAPPILAFLAWFVPVAIIVWAAASGIGRNAVLRAYDPSLPRRWGSLILLQLLRVVFLAGSVVFWFASIRWAARTTLTGDAPNIIAYFALIIGLSLAVFVLWAVVSWIFSIAPLIVLLENCSVAASLARSIRLGPLKGKLVEINLIMGIIKLALIALAMVWSALPLPFEATVQGPSLYAWWTVGTILYCIASDFFQVVRLAAFIEFWKLARQIA